MRTAIAILADCIPAAHDLSTYDEGESLARIAGAAQRRFRGPERTAALDVFNASAGLLAAVRYRRKGLIDKARITERKASDVLCRLGV